MIRVTPQIVLSFFLFLLKAQNKHFGFVSVALLPSLTQSVTDVSSNVALTTFSFFRGVAHLLLL